MSVEKKEARTLTQRWRDSEYRESGLRLLALAALTLPVAIGYVWIIVSTFADRTYGLIPVNDEGRFGGLTLRNWSFLWNDPTIWVVTFNTFMLATGMTVIVVAISALAGYALSRLGFSGRRTFLAGTLILHAFPSVTLLISIFFVLRWLSNIPLIGNDLPVIGGLGYDTVGGVILVSVALQLPLGVWLMKGFFDGVSWDMERSALIDGCSRFGAWWRVVLPQVRPGIAALSIFSFIIGWGSFIIPYTYIASAKSNVIAVYLNQLLGDTTPVNYGQVAAVGLFQLIPVVVFFLFTQKYLLNIFAGGAKGGS
jgi:inositol-phosphate transport system permease protein